MEKIPKQEDYSDESVEKVDMERQQSVEDQHILSVEEQNQRDIEVAKQIEELKSGLIKVQEENPESIRRFELAKAVKDLRTSYHFLMTQPDSIDRWRMSQEMVENSFDELVQIAGKEKATEELENIKKEYPDEPKIKYENKFDEIRDKIITKIKDFLYIE